MRTDKHLKKIMEKFNKGKKSKGNKELERALQHTQFNIHYVFCISFNQFQ